MLVFIDAQLFPWDHVYAVLASTPLGIHMWDLDADIG